MRKLFFTTALFFVCTAGPALSLPKIDAGGSAAEITKTISGYLETGKKKWMNLWQYKRRSLMAKALLKPVKP